MASVISAHPLMIVVDVSIGLVNDSWMPGSGSSFPGIPSTQEEETMRVISNWPHEWPTPTVGLPVRLTNKIIGKVVEVRGDDVIFEIIEEALTNRAVNPLFGDVSKFSIADDE